MQRCDHCPIARQEMPLFLCVVLDGGDDTRKLAVLTRPTLRHCAPKFRGVSARPMVRYYIYFIATLEVEIGIGPKVAHIPEHIKYFIFLFIFHRKKVHFLKITKFINS